jgi:hypothetical protein
MSRQVLVVNLCKYSHSQDVSYSLALQPDKGQCLN